MVKIRQCRKVDIEHSKSKRQYAHVLHYPEVICVARAFYNLPYHHQLGIIFHELGHLIAIKEIGEHTEKDADRMIEKYAGVKVKYVDNRYGRRLETI